jgi:dTDP-4-dehydrorhamnose 3,5-epimerase-like enzyme
MSVSDGRGQIAILEDPPFPIRRIFYIRNMLPDTIRGYHALCTCEQLFIIASGSCLLRLEGRQDIRLVNLSIHSPRGVYVPPLIWRTLYRFTPDTVVIVLASEKYDKDGYYRNREEWEALVKSGGSTG